MTTGTAGLAAVAACSAISGPFATSTSAFATIISLAPVNAFCSLGAAIFHDKILALGESELTQFGKEDLVTWPRDRIAEVRAQNADTGDPASLLRARAERPIEHRAAEQRDELAPFYI